MQIFATTGFALMSNPPERATLNVLLRLRLFDSARCDLMTAVPDSLSDVVSTSINYPTSRLSHPPWTEAWVRHGVHDIGTESYEFCRGCT
jgi:hypothetical protein